MRKNKNTKENKDAILYIGFAVPEKIQTIINQIDDLPHYATHKFAWSIVRCLDMNFTNLNIVSTAEIRNYPAVDKIFFKSQQVQHSKFNVKFIGFINIILLKHVSRLLIIILKSTSLLKNNSIKNILVHGSHTPFMIYAILLKFFFDKKISILLTDQHGLFVENDGYLGKVFRKIDTFIMKALLKKFDGYICLSKSFVSKYNLIPSLVFPGIINREFTFDLSEKDLERKKINKFVIKFAGGLNKNNGIDIFLDSMKYIKRKDICFHFLGKGELKEKILKLSKVDSRISYLGLKEGKELYTELLKSDLLINPRPIHDEYSKTSFPSKLIEYLNTGVPTLTSKIQSIPNELKDSFYYIDKVNPEGVAKSILILIDIPKSQRNLFAKKAKINVRSHYSEKIIGEKIHQFINSLI